MKGSLTKFLRLMEMRRQLSYADKGISAQGFVQMVLYAGYSCAGKFFVMLSHIKMPGSAVFVADSTIVFHTSRARTSLEIFGLLRPTG